MIVSIQYADVPLPIGGVSYLTVGVEAFRHNLSRDTDPGIAKEVKRRRQHVVDKFVEMGYPTHSIVDISMATPKELTMPYEAWHTYSADVAALCIDNLNSHFRIRSDSSEVTINLGVGDALFIPAGTYVQFVGLGKLIRFAKAPGAWTPNHK